MKISCIIIEDQVPAQKILQRYIADMGTIALKGTFNNAISALEFLKTTSVDVIFLDIHLPKISGINFLQILTPHPKIIFTTAFSEYAIQSYELDVVDYLLKPFSFERFVKAVSKIYPTPQPASAPMTTPPLKSTTTEEEEFIFVKDNNDYLKINTCDIQYIKSDGDYTKIFTVDKAYFVAYSLRYWNEQLPTKYFCQIHKSYIINIQFITRISGNQAFIADQALPIGRTFKDHFFTNYLKNPLK
ncbi:MAG TPA: DNA-binding response regulator [Microscillaceae bacterium]|nr:DNA-binding response regulator [Microscillaceae bacterium]